MYDCFLLTKALRHVTDDVRKRLLGREADESLRLFDGRHAAAHVLEAAVLVRLFVGNVDDVALGLCQLLDECRQLVDRHFRRIAEIDHLAKRLGRLKQDLFKSLHDVCDMAEAPALLAVIIDRDRLARKRVLDETRHDHAVLSGLTRPDGIEKPDHDDGKLRLPVMRERQKFVRGLRIRIRPTTDGGRPHDAVVIFAERHLRALAVDLARRCHENPPPITAAGIKDSGRAADDCLNGLDRFVDDQLHAHGARQVIDRIALADRPIDHGRIQHRVDNHVEIGVSVQVLHVFEPTRGQVVQDRNLMPFLEQQITQMRADETASTCYQNFHVSFPSLGFSIAQIRDVLHRRSIFLFTIRACRRQHGDHGEPRRQGG